MTALEPILERLSLQEYYDSLVAEGFDTWETVLDIQESDLESLNVKLGHRRRLQRAIAEYRGIAGDQPLGSPTADIVNQEILKKESQAQQQGQNKVPSSATTEQKRRYRRHPKPDENAPERPPSAYVIFSSRIREEVKNENLSFTEIARLVGERWQKLDPVEKERYEAHATTLKEDYSVQLTEYKKTPEHRQYQEYLVDFRAKHPNVISTDSKRPKLESSDSPTLSAMSPDESSEMITLTSGHTRSGSIAPASAASFVGQSPAPSAPSLNLASTVANISSVVGRRGSPHHRGEPETRVLGRFSGRSPMSEESGGLGSESADQIPRSTKPSFGGTPTSSPPPSATTNRLPKQDYYASEAQYSQWSGGSPQPGSYRSPLSTTPSMSPTGGFSPIASGAVPISQLVNPTTQSQVGSDRLLRSPSEHGMSPPTTSGPFNVFASSATLPPPRPRQPPSGPIAFRQGQSREHTTIAEREDLETTAKESDDVSGLDSTKSASRRSDGRR